MQQNIRTCLINNHNFLNIERICLYPGCKYVRFLCPNCINEQIHKHDQLDDKHIYDSKRFYNKLMNQIKQIQTRQIEGLNNLDSIIHLKQLVSEIQNKIKEIINLIQIIQSGEFLNDFNDQLKTCLKSIEKHGFNIVDDQQINRVINLHSQYQTLDIYQQLRKQSDIIIQNAQRLSEWKLSFIDKSLEQIKVAKYSIEDVDELPIKQNSFYSGGISNDLKYIISGYPNYCLKIWDYSNFENNQLIKLDNTVHSCKFTDDSELLYVGSYCVVYQIDTINQFNIKLKYNMHDDFINNICCITNTILLTSSDDKTIIKTDILKSQQLFRIQAHDDYIGGLDYNGNLHHIVSSCFDRSIKLWDGQDGQLLISKKDAQNNKILQVLFITNKNQIVSLSAESNIIIWSINYQSKSLEQLGIIDRKASSISLALNQAYILVIGNQYLDIYKNSGQLIRSFFHEVEKFWYFNLIQPQYLEAIIIKGKSKIYVIQDQIQICKIDLQCGK